MVKFCRSASKSLIRPLLTNIREETHKPSTFDGIARCALEGRAEAAPLPAEHFALASDKLLEVAHVLVIDERGTGATFLRAEPASVFTVLTQLLPHHTRHLALAVRMYALLSEVSEELE